MMTDAGAPAPAAPRPNYVGLGFLGFLLVVGAAYTVVAVGYGMTAETNPLGPGAAPAAMGALLMLGCLLLLGQEIRSYRRAKAASDRGEEHGHEAQPGARDLVKPILILLILIAGLMLTPITGMMIAMPLVVMAIAFFVEKLKPVYILIMGAVTALMLWLVFDLLLSVRFPTSLIGL
ncbi:tripartite tricarboxylate transporter TctB family protein [Citricoccus sp. NPDC055426]|uniref:tripartite tricarboxylate transporter TctB family protein n=1 Tax=Citricoccus sp. NPDC055426 TaxID=3155536 RepID=UPI003440A0B3